MNTYNSIKEYVGAINRRSAKLKNLKSPGIAAKIHSTIANRLAPVDKGNLKAGLMTQKIDDNTYSSISGVFHKFPYNFWVNKRMPYANPKMVWNGGKPTIYGDGSHQITGIPGFFDIATAFMIKNAPQIEITEIRSIMQSK